MYNLLVSNKEFAGIIITFLSVVIPLATFLVSKNKEQKQINFERFHGNLMKGLANLDKQTGLDQQIAIIYESRNYPEYYPVIRRILKYQMHRWKLLLNSKPQFKQLIDEAKETINFSSKNFIIRFGTNFLNKYFCDYQSS